MWQVLLKEWWVVTRRLIDIESLADFDAHIGKTRRLNGWFVQSVDLTERTDALRRSIPAARSSSVASSPRRSNTISAGPVRCCSRACPTCRSTRTEHVCTTLPSCTAPANTPPAWMRPIYAWSHAHPAASLTAELGTTLHDHAIADALEDATTDLDRRKIVGIMGGHAVPRGEETYRAAAELGANLTAVRPHRPHWRRSRGDGGSKSRCLPEPVAGLARGCPDDHDTARRRTGPASMRGRTRAFEVRARWPVASAGRSLSIPTWFYGHEPTNVFATEIAKYFSNALREDTLLHHCGGGVVYLPGSGRHGPGDLPSRHRELLRCRCRV